MAEFAITTKDTIPDVKVDTATANSTSSTNIQPSDIKSNPTSLETTKNNLDVVKRDAESGASISSPSNFNIISENDVPSNVNIASTEELESNQGELVLPPTKEPSGSLSYTSTVNSDEKILAEISNKQAQVTELKKRQETALAGEKLMADRKELANAFTELGDMGDYIAQVEEEAELNKRREELTEITNKIRGKELDFRRQVEALQDAPGLTREQKNAQIADVDRRNSREIADLEIIAMARQGRFNDASAIVDRKVEIEMQARANQLEGMKFLYSENKERFTTLEQREFERTILKEERAYQSEYDKRKELESLKLQMTINATEAGASMGELENIQKAEDTTKLFSLPNASRYSKSKGQILDEQLKSAQIASIWNSMKPDPATATFVGLDGNAYTKEEIDSFQAKNEVLTQVLSQVNKLKTMSGKSGAVGASVNKFLKMWGEGDTFAGSDASSYAEEVNRLVALLSFENLDKLKGSMSDNDLKFLKSIGSSLNLRSSETGFDSELLRIENESKAGYDSTANILGIPAWGSEDPDTSADRAVDEVDKILQSGSNVYQSVL